MPAIMDAADVLEDPTSIDSEAVEELATHRVSPIAEEGPAAPEADVESTTSSKAVDDIAADIALLRESLSNGHASEAESSTAVSVADSSTETDPPKEKARRDSSTTRASTRSRSGTNRSSDRGHVRRLSASKIQELTEAPDSLPVTAAPEHPLSAGLAETINRRPSMSTQLAAGPQIVPDAGDGSTASRPLSQPPATRRNTSTQPSAPVASNRRNSYQLAPRPAPLNLESCSNLSSSNPPSKHPEQPSRQSSRTEPRDTREPRPPSPIPPTIPLPPLSVPTLLQLELAAQRPSPLYIHQSYANDLPYESSAVKFERLKNFLLLPQYLERLLVFGALACLDAWLWTFTILPMRFFIALGVLINWWGYILMKEARWLVAFVWEGLGRMWRRARRGRTLSRTASSASLRSTADEKSRSRSGVREVSKEPPSVSGASTGLNGATTETIRRPDNLRTRTGTVTNGSTHMPSRAYSTRSHNTAFRHRRTKSMPSNLTTFHKADLLQGAIIIFSSIALMNLDASRMYHFVRAQSAVKLYVIYNLVEVGDRLLSALGQDIFECLFSSETLSRNSSGRSKILLPFGMFLLSLVYNCAHAVTLFYQVITLNVCVNSYSNALLTLLMSNQFVEIKSSVFKRFEKENTFQLTCADIVERFQLWVVLLIIAMRNIVEVGGLSVPGAGTELGDDGGAASSPLHSPSILPASFTLLPTWFWSGEVLSPFLIVIGSEMLVDWIKHAYINKFNNIKPNFYSRILDILCKDYYTNAFVTPSLTRRLGLPLLPLSCLFIRASFQTYHMFLAIHLPAPLPASTQTSLSVESATPTSQAVTAALDRLDHVIRNALGRSVYGFPYSETAADNADVKTLWFSWTTDDLIALATLLVVFFIAFLVLLIVKLLLGMALLRYSRDRYARMKMREHAVAVGKAEKDNFDAKGKRVGGYGHVEIGEDRRRWIYGPDDVEGLKKSKEKERRAEEKKEKADVDFGKISRYEMIAKRIW